MQSVIWQKNLRMRIDPDAVKDFTLDFSAWLDGETVASTVFTGTGITVVSSYIAGAGELVVFRVSGATVGCSVKVRVTTNTGQVDDWTIGFDVQQK